MVSIRDGIHSGWCPFEILRDCVHSGLCPFGMVSIRDCIHSGWCPFGIVYFRDGVYSGLCPFGQWFGYPSGTMSQTLCNAYFCSHSLSKIPALPCTRWFFNFFSLIYTVVKQAPMLVIHTKQLKLSVRKLALSVFCKDKTMCNALYEHRNNNLTITDLALQPIGKRCHLNILFNLESFLYLRIISR